MSESAQRRRAAYIRVVIADSDVNGRHVTIRALGTQLLQQRRAASAGRGTNDQTRQPQK